jgi:tetratricopeptide (TPR) repeat protein
MSQRSAILLPAVALLICLASAPATASVAIEFERATSLTMQGDHDGAIRQYEAFLARAPAHRLSPVAASAIANIHLRARHDTAAAIQSLDLILDEHRTSPWAPEAARQKGALAEAEESWIPAAESYELAINLAGAQRSGTSDDWLNEVTLAAASCYYRAGADQKVIETYENVLAHSPPPEVAASALYRLGESYESADDRANAAESYVRVLEAYPSTAMFEPAMAKREIVDEHVEFDWQPREAYAQGTALIAAGDFPGAIEKCDEILSGSATGPLRECTEYRKIALETAESGNFTEGCRRLRQFIDEHPDGLRTELAERTLENEWSRISELEARAREAPEDAATLSALGRAYLQARSLPKGIETLERALALDREDAAAHFLLGNAYLRAGRSEEAIKAFSFYLESNPDDVNALNMIGYAFLGQGEPEKAIPYFERYAEIAPEEANAHDSLGEGYLTAGRLEEAAREYERAIEIDPSFFNSQFMLGRVYQEMEENEKAVAAYERFLAIVSRGPQADQARAAIAELRAQ